MTEYNYSPEARAAYQQKLKGVSSWAQDVSRYEPVNPFVTPPASDRDSSFYTKYKSKGERRARSLLSYGAREPSSDEDEDGPDRPPTPPRNAVAPGYPPNPYGHPSFAPGGTWQSPAGYLAPPTTHRSPAPPPAIFSNATLQPLVPTFNPQINLWEYREQHQHARPASLHTSSSRPRSRRSKRTGSLPTALSLAQAIQPSASLPSSPHLYAQPLSPLHSPPLYGYSSGQPSPSVSTMYLPSGHTSPASLAYAPLPQPHSAPLAQTTMQHQQQLAAQARGMQYYGQPTMSPPLPAVPTASYPGYHTPPSTAARMGYVSPSNGSVMSGPPAQPWATVILDSKKKSRDSGSSFFGRLGSSGSRKRR